MTKFQQQLANKVFTLSHIISYFHLQYAILCLTNVNINARLTHFLVSVMSLLWRKNVLLYIGLIYAVHAPTAPTRQL